MAETEQPRKTISFDSLQWRNVIQGDLSRLHGIIGQVQSPLNEQGINEVGRALLDKIGTMIGAMNLCLTKEAADAAAMQAAANQPQVQAQPAPVANGNAAPVHAASDEPQVVPIAKKKGGWPAGKPRGKRKAAVAQ